MSEETFVVERGTEHRPSDKRLYDQRPRHLAHCRDGVVGDFLHANEIASAHFALDQ